MSDNNDGNSRIDRVPEGYMWMRRRHGDEEIEIIGKAEDIKTIYKDVVSSNGHKPKETVKIDQPKLPLFEEDSTPLLLQGNDVQSSDVHDGNLQTNVKQPSNDDFIQFWEEKSPQNQMQQITIVTYYWIQHLGYDRLKIADYEQAFHILAEIPVDRPDIKKAIQNNINNLQHVRSLEKGKGEYALTRTGKQFVESIGKEQEG
jgi:hypothetical protein